MAIEKRARVPNPENLLIDLLAEEIERDESILEALGAGTVSLEDMEHWYERRGQVARGFLEEAGRLVAEMRAQGFERSMRRSGKSRAAPRREGGGPLRFERPAGKRAAKPAPPPQRFYLDLRDLKAGCRMRLSGDYEELLDAGTWHMRRAHKLHGSEASVRELVESAISEVPLSRLSLEERTRGLRPEEAVSDESANRTRPAGGYYSA
jgi:hypothetical protein